MNDDAERKKVVRLVGALALGASLACGASQAPEKDLSTLRARAARDFNCSEERIVINKIDEATRGASGCGKRASYINRARPCEPGEKPESDGRCDAWLQTSIENTVDEAPSP